MLFSNVSIHVALLAISLSAMLTHMPFDLVMDDSDVTLHALLPRELFVAMLALELHDLLVNRVQVFLHMGPQYERLSANLAWIRCIVLKANIDGCCHCH